MKISVSLMQYYAGNAKIVPKSIDELVEKIGAQLGAIEEVIDVGKKYKGIIVAKVVECEKHPNADKLSVCKIDDGRKAKGVKRDEKGLVQVVCGAPNVKAGILAAWLPPGAIVPSTVDSEEFKLEARDIRGVVSNGMLASASELGISEDHSGIIEVDEKAKPGDDFAEIYKLNDYVIDIENKMFTHRPDCFGQLGVAREIAGITQQRFTSPNWYTQEPKFGQSKGLPLKVKVEDSKLVPRFMAVAMKNVQIGPSPLWLQATLSILGVRPINNVVDLTNYYMVLTAQPLHAYDYDKVKAQDPGANEATLLTRLPKKGEKLILLGGKTVEPHSQAVVIATATQAIGLGGVMGGADTEVDDNTKNIILECANFDMYSTRKTAMEHGLFTDAATRFTKGQSPHQNDRVLAKIMADIKDLAGGEPASAVQDVKKRLPEPTGVRVSAEFINERLGLNLTPKKIAELLENVEFKVLSLSRGQLGITPPFWRTDIEIAEDIVEEVGRLYGYDHLPLELPKRDFKPTDKNELIEFKDRVREILSRAGANELLTYSFVHGDLIAKTTQDKSKAFRLSNAVSPDLQYYRLSITPSLLDKVHPNIKAGVNEFALFEIGKAHAKGMDDKEGLPAEFNRISLVFAAESKTAGANYSGSAFYQARNYLMLLLETFGKDKAVKFVPLKKANYKEHFLIEQMAKPFEPDRSAAILDGELIVGVVGEYKSSVTEALKLPAFCAGFESFHSYLLKDEQANPYTPLSRFPKVWQDISLKVKAELGYGELYEFLRDNLEIPADTTAELSPVDIYQREDDQEHKQVTLRLTISSFERTLTDTQVNQILDDVAAKTHEKFGAERI